MYCYLKTNLGVIALSKDEMERVRLPQKLCHAEGKTIDEIATLLYISGMSAARLVGYHELLDKEGHRIYFGVDHSEAAEQVLMKVLFPLNQ